MLNYYKIFMGIYQFIMPFHIYPVLGIIFEKVADIMLCIISDIPF